MINRRAFLVWGVQSAATCIASAAALTVSQRPALAEQPQRRYVIVNGDDFGQSQGINSGLIEAHERGIVTSASLIVDAPHARAAVELAKRQPNLSLGIHVALDRAGTWLVEPGDLDAVRAELDRQLRQFRKLTGGPPTHVDSHHHRHAILNIGRLFIEAGERYHSPVRGFSRVVYVGRFYGLSPYGRADASRISSASLISILTGVRPGISEISCHPGHADGESDADYNAQRELELRSLTDPTVKAAIRQAGIVLINYRDYRRLGAPAAPATAALPCP